MNTEDTATLSKFLHSAGMYLVPIEGSQQIGVSEKGNPVYANSQLINSKDLNVGKGMTGIMHSMLKSFGVLKDGDEAKLTALGEAAANPEVLSKLDSMAQNRDVQGFTDTLAKHTGQSIDPIFSEAANSYHQYWDRMSPSQKSLAMASAGLYNVKGVDGASIGSRNLPATENTGYMPLQARKAHELLQKGYNATSLAKNWETINDIHALAGGHSDPEDVADMASGMGMLGFGMNGQAAGNVTAESLAGTGWAASPHHGVGAITGRADSPVPANFMQVASDGRKKVAVPSANIPTVASGATSGSLLNTQAGHGGVSDSAQKLYSTWKGAHTTKANNGVVGGSAMVSGLYGMSRTNPLLFSATVAASFVDPKNKSRDYANDVHYLTHLGVTSLDRLSTGDKAPKTQTDVKPILSAVGGSELNKSTFNTLTTKLRAEYASKGVKSKADAYALTNQAFAEHRINAVDLVGMQKTFNMLYDRTGMDTAHKLLTGREKGIELAQKKGRVSGIQASMPMNTEPAAPKLSKDEIRMRNRARYAGVARPAQPAQPAEVSMTGV